MTRKKCGEIVKNISKQDSGKQWLVDIFNKGRKASNREIQKMYLVAMYLDN